MLESDQELADVVAALTSGDQAALAAALLRARAISARLGQELHWTSGASVTPGWDAKALAKTLIDMKREHQPTKLVSDLVVAYAGELHGEHVTTIYGARAAERLDVAEKFAIVPLTGDDHHDQSMLGLEWAEQLSHDTALTMAATDRHARKRPDFEPIEAKMLQEIEEVLGIVSLVCRRGIFRGIQWSRSPNWLWPGVGRTTALGEVPIVRGLTPHLITAEEAAECRRLHPLLVQLPDKARNVLTFSLRSYRKAVKRPLLEQAAVAITVAIEGLLMQGQQGDLVQSVSMRGAWLLARDVSERLAYADALRTAYKLRNDFVHGGGIKLGWSLNAGSAERQELKLVESLYERMVVRLLEHGVPTADQWTEIVLGRPFAEVMKRETKNAPPPRG